MSLANVLIRPVVTEKTTLQQDQNRYVFEVDSSASKEQIAKAVEWAFDVKVIKVNTLTVPGKVKRYGRRPSKQPDWKKAIVSLAAGDSIQLFEGA
ncbi:MAG: 50S ribosomal protein L23 [Dehalococcoidia bacterium]|jgi:large subunit ribosomal protein L23